MNTMNKFLFNFTAKRVNRHLICDYKAIKRRQELLKNLYPVKRCAGHINNANKIYSILITP